MSIHGANRIRIADGSCRTGIELRLQRQACPDFAGIGSMRAGRFSVVKVALFVAFGMLSRFIASCTLHDLRGP